MRSVKDPQKKTDKSKKRLNNLKPDGDSPSGSSTAASVETEPDSTQRKLREINKNATESHPFGMGT
jgi:hypothetical protein